MKHITRFLLCGIIALGFSACTTTTTGGNVGADRSQLLLVNEETMEESARQSYEEVLQEARANGTLNTNAATTQWVRNIAERLIAQTGAFREDALNWDWQVNVISDSTVNAWCMPGGRIVVYTGIIDSLDLTDAQLAAVMGHEIAHALREHSRERASQEGIKTVAVSAAASALGLGDGGLSLLTLASQYTITLPNSRKHETEADHIGTELMARAGYDPYEAVNVWKKMSALGGSSVPQIMSTHPSHETRIKDLEVIAQKVYPLYEATLQ